LLYPDDLVGYAGYEDFFSPRRRKFFGLVATAIVFDFVDTLPKGSEHYAIFHDEYLIRLSTYLLPCGIAMATRRRWFHGV
jgi:hypothetical protein